MSDKAELLTATQAAEMLQVDRDTVKRYLENGKLEGFQLPGKHWRVYKNSVEKMMGR